LGVFEYNHGAMDEHRALEIPPGDLEVHPGALEANPRAIEANPGALEVHPGACGQYTAIISLQGYILVYIATGVASVSPG
jgi:hypothetical protein